LADDGQYWIGHTYEYHARAIGKLDKKRIVLNTRTLQSRAEIVADLELRQRYYPEATEGFLVQEALWDDHLLGVLTSGSKRDRVNAELLKAIEAYHKVIENFEMGDLAGKALLRIAVIYTEYLKDTEKGITAYQELLENYPGSQEAENALYEVGVYQMEKQQYEQAIKLFQQFGHRFPSSPKTEDAMLAVSRCYVELKAWAEAVDAYKRYLNQFPNGKHAKFAQAQIEWIRMYYF
jgi:TolA-binding protein